MENLISISLLVKDLFISLAMFLEDSPAVEAPCSIPWLIPFGISSETRKSVAAISACTLDACPCTRVWIFLLYLMHLRIHASTNHSWLTPTTLSSTSFKVANFSSEALISSWTYNPLEAPSVAIWPKSPVYLPRPRIEVCCPIIDRFLGFFGGWQIISSTLIADLYLICSNMFVVVSSNLIVFSTHVINSLLLSSFGHIFRMLQLVYLTHFQQRQPHSFSWCLPVELEMFFLYSVCNSVWVF